jgi:hypothetical protein
LGRCFIFGLKGMPEIKLKMKESHPTKVVLELQVINSIYIDSNIATISDISCDVQLDFEGEFNSMMARR